MIEIGNPSHAVDPAVLDAPGGFAWWYVDVISPEGDGLVLIWSYGLPFLPGYAGSARRGFAERPASRPSVNLAVYRRAAESFYLLQEYPDTAPATLDGQAIGACRFVWRAHGTQFTLTATLDCPVPGTPKRLTGTVRLEGALCHTRDGTVGSERPPHVWTPICAPATASVQLAVGGTSVASFAGRAYHDRNTGLVPLHELGIRRWMWGRIPTADSDRVYYLLWPSDAHAQPRCVGLEFRADGSTVEVPNLRVEISGERATPFGLRVPRRIRMLRGTEPWLDVAHTATVDVAPFYARFQSRAASSLGWSELCEPDRIDQPWFRPFVRMRVERTGYPNSMWLPLFNGSHEDRWRRWLRHAIAWRR